MKSYSKENARELVSKIIGGHLKADDMLYHNGKTDTLRQHIREARYNGYDLKYFIRRVGFCKVQKTDTVTMI